MTGSHNLSSLIWGFADLLRNNVEVANYHKVILPLTLLRRFDCVLSEGVLGETAKDKIKLVVDKKGYLLEGSTADRKSFNDMAVSVTGVSFYNISNLDFNSLAASSPTNVLSNFRTYIDGFSDNVKDILENFSFTRGDSLLETLNRKGILTGITQRFSGLDLSPAALPNEDMGELYEELVRKWADSIKAAAGEFFTPRDIVHLLVDLVLSPKSGQIGHCGATFTGD